MDLGMPWWSKKLINDNGSAADRLHWLYVLERDLPSYNDGVFGIIVPTVFPLVDTK